VRAISLSMLQDKVAADEDNIIADPSKCSKNVKQVIG